MKKSLYGIKPYYYFIIIGIALIAFIIGSFCDLSLAEALYDKNNVVANSLESWLIGISFLMVPASGGYLLAYGLTQKKLPLKLLGIILGILAYIAMVFIYRGFVYQKNAGQEVTYQNVLYGYRLSSSFLSYLIPALILIIPFLLAFFFADRSNPAKLLRISLIIIIAFALEHLTCELVKYLAMRPRYRFLVDSDLNTVGATFTAWWNWNPFSQTSGDCFKSFPSGHTAASCITLLSPLLVGCSKYRFKHDQLVFFLLGCCFVLFVAIFRMIAGAHYLSDVSMGAIISCGISLLTLFLGSRVIKPEEGYELSKRA